MARRARRDSQGYRGGAPIVIWYSRLVRKDFNPVTGKVIFGPALASKKQAEIDREIGLKPNELNLRQIAFERRALYALGVAAFRELRKKI